MASLVQSGKYGSIDTTDTATNRFYVIMFTLEVYKLQDNTKVDRQIIISGKLFAKEQYLCYIQVENNWFWGQHPKQQVITLLTRKIIHTQLDVTTITYIHDIPKSVYNRTQAQKYIYRHIICLTDSYYDYILEDIDWRYLFFERDVNVLSDEKENLYEYFK